MKIRNADFKGFAQAAKQDNKKIILWGIGTFFKTCIPYLLREYGLTDDVCCLIDKDESKWGQTLVMNKKTFQIQPPSSILKWKDQNCQLLITSSYFAGILDWIDSLGDIPVECYVAPFMFLPHKDGGYSLYQCEEQQIPKVIHYCWFGKVPIPEKNLRCIESWKKQCPDYEIIQWNEDNYDLGKNRYMSQAYELGKYGFVPDFARIDLLYHYGGIYFDTDVELLKNIDDLLYLKGFTSFEEYPMVNFGGGSGSVKGLPVLKEILDFRSGFDFVGADGKRNLLTCGYYETLPLLERGLKAENRIQTIEDLTVLTSDYFHVKSTVTKEIRIKEDTLGVHDFNWSWVSEEQKEEQRRTGELVERYFGQ